MHLYMSLSFNFGVYPISFFKFAQINSIGLNIGIFLGRYNNFEPFVVIKSFKPLDRLTLALSKTNVNRSKHLILFFIFYIVS